MGDSRSRRLAKDNQMNVDSSKKRSNDANSNLGSHLLMQVSHRPPIPHPPNECIQHSTPHNNNFEFSQTNSLNPSFSVPSRYGTFRGADSIMSQTHMRISSPKPDLRKTRMCPHVASCPYTSDECNFAHTQSELRVSHDHFYKISMCAFFERKACRNGELCRFAHGENDRRFPRNFTLMPPESDQRQEELERHPKMDFGRNCHHAFGSGKLKCDRKEKNKMDMMRSSNRFHNHRNNNSEQRANRGKGSVCESSEKVTPGSVVRPSVDNPGRNGLQPQARSVEGIVVGRIADEGVCTNSEDLTGVDSWGNRNGSALKLSEEIVSPGSVSSGEFRHPETCHDSLANTVSPELESNGLLSNKKISSSSIFQNHDQNSSMETDGHRGLFDVGSSSASVMQMSSSASTESRLVMDDSSTGLTSISTCLASTTRRPKEIMQREKTTIENNCWTDQQPFCDKQKDRSILSRTPSTMPSTVYRSNLMTNCDSNFSDCFESPLITRISKDATPQLTCHQPILSFPVCPSADHKYDLSDPPVPHLRPLTSAIGIHIGGRRFPQTGHSSMPLGLVTPEQSTAIPHRRPPPPGKQNGLFQRRLSMNTPKSQSPLMDESRIPPRFQNESASIYNQWNDSATHFGMQGGTFFIPYPGSRSLMSFPPPLVGNQHAGNGSFMIPSDAPLDLMASRPSFFPPQTLNSEPDMSGVGEFSCLGNYRMPNEKKLIEQERQFRRCPKSFDTSNLHPSPLIQLCCRMMEECPESFDDAFRQSLVTQYTL